MSYAVEPAGGAKTRPTIVTAASGLLYLCAGLLVVSALLGILQVPLVNQVFDEAEFQTPDSQAMRGIVIGSVIGGLVVSALLGVGLGTLGFFVGKGKQGARITTWVIAGLGVLCLGCSQILGAATGGMQGSGSGNTDAQRVTERIAEVVPSWQSAVSTVFGIINLVALVAVIILLALPAANEFFRKQEAPAWVPPTTWPGDPAAGGLPPYLPPAPGAPPAPPAPGAPPAPPPYNPPAPPQ